MHRILRANRLIRNSRVVTLVGFGLLVAAALAMIIGLIRSRDADMLVLHTLDVQGTAQTLLIATLRKAPSAAFSSAATMRTSRHSNRPWSKPTRISIR